LLANGEISIHDDRWLTYPWGVNGGEPGMRSRKELIKANGERRMLPSKCDHIKVENGDLVVFDTWGGGGWGNPLERDPDAVATDLRRGLISVEGARRYGVVLNAKGVIDDAATQELKAELAKHIDTDQLFNRGGTIEEIKARCLEETGLPAPATPTWENQGA